MAVTWLGLTALPPSYLLEISLKFKTKGEKQMKTKLFFYRGWKQSLEEFEQEVNDFMATVQVVDVKISEATFGSSEDMAVQTTLLVIYQ